MVELVGTSIYNNIEHKYYNQDKLYPLNSDLEESTSAVLSGDQPKKLSSCVKNIAEGKTTRQLIIFTGVGLGKTTTMHAITNDNPYKCPIPESDDYPNNVIAGMKVGVRKLYTSDYYLTPKLVVVSESYNYEKLIEPIAKYLATKLDYNCRTDMCETSSMLIICNDQKVVDGFKLALKDTNRLHVFVFDKLSSIPAVSTGKSQ
jgi:hypothetical protein